MERIAVMAFGVADDRQLEVRDQIVVPLNEGEVDVDALADAGIGKVLAHPGGLGNDHPT
jgi:hypothetical protein